MALVLVPYGRKSTIISSVRTRACLRTREHAYAHIPFVQYLFDYTACSRKITGFSLR